MIVASVAAIQWGSGTTTPSDASPPSASDDWDDWFSGFDFGDLPPTVSEEADLAEFLALDDVLDLTDLPLPDDPPAVNFCDSFLSILKPDAADQEELESEAPLVTNSPTVSLHSSEAGSSFAAGDGSPATETLENHGFNLGNPYIYSEVGSLFAAGEGSPATETLENYGFNLENPNIYSSTKFSQKYQNQVGPQPDPSNKKKLRLLRNRELAFESRQRKKSYISDLEAKCKMLEQERNQLQQQICFSSAENVVLKEELSRLKKMKGSNGVAEPAVLFEDSLPLEFLSLLICLCLLLARLSLCVNPFLVLVLRAVLLPQSSSSRVKAGGLSKEQVDSNGYSDPLANCARGFHFPSRIYMVF